MMSINQAGITMNNWRSLVAIAIVASSLLVPVTGAQEKNGVKSRRFLFTYAGAIKELKPGQTVDVWLPVAVDGPEQTVKTQSMKMPANGTVRAEKQYGNTSLYFQAKANDKGEVPFEVTYNVTRKEVKTDVASGIAVKPATSENLTRFLQPD